LIITNVKLNSERAFSRTFYNKTAFYYATYISVNVIYEIINTWKSY